MTLIRKDSLAQLRRIRSIMKGIDVGDKIKDITDKYYNGTNGATYKNGLDGYVDTWEDYMKNQRKYLDQASKQLKTYEAFTYSSDYMPSEGDTVLSCDLSEDTEVWVLKFSGNPDKEILVPNTNESVEIIFNLFRIDVNETNH